MVPRLAGGGYTLSYMSCNTGDVVSLSLLPIFHRSRMLLLRGALSCQQLRRARIRHAAVGAGCMVDAACVATRITS